MIGWHDTPWMWLSMLLFWALLIAFAFFAFRGAASSRFPGRGSGAAAILEQRLARGEISPEEYRERLATLERTTAP